MSFTALPPGAQRGYKSRGGKGLTRKDTSGSEELGNTLYFDLTLIVDVMLAMHLRIYCIRFSDYHVDTVVSLR